MSARKPSRAATSIRQDLPSDLRDAVDAAFGITIAAATKLVGMGDECDIWRVQTAQGTFAVRVSGDWRSGRKLAWGHRLMTFLAPRLPEVVVPLTTASGATTFDWKGRPVSVVPWIEGEPADESSPGIGEPAGRLLARLHNAMLESLAGVESSGLANPDEAPWDGVESDELKDADLDSALQAARSSTATVRGPIHGDYYPRNLICKNGRIVGVIDWDDSHYSLLVQELGWAIWEFSQDQVEPDLDVDAARRFLAAYRSENGPVPPDENRLLVPMIRKRLREEVQWALAARDTHPELFDREYADREIEAFDRLSDLHVDW